MFLVLIGLINLVVLRHIADIFRKMRSGDYDEAELERRLDERGLLNRVLRGLTRWIRKPVHVSTRAAVRSRFRYRHRGRSSGARRGAAAGNLPWYAILTLPVLFAAGMTLLDAANGCFMNLAYGWSVATLIRKVFYNITITGLSVAVALLIGGIQLIGLIAERLQIVTGLLAWIAGLDLGAIGYLIAAVFACTWLIAVAAWRFGHLEQRWTPEDFQP